MDQHEMTQNQRIEMLEEQNRKLARVLEALDVIPDADMVLPTEWIEDRLVPVPWVDRATCPPYIVAGYLMERRGADLCRVDAPEMPFNPWWGINGHPKEGLGIDHYVAADHAGYLLPCSDERGDLISQAARAARAAAVKAADNIEINDAGYTERLLLLAGGI